MDKRLVYLREAVLYFLVALIGGIVGLYFGAIYGGNYGFDWSFFLPGYEGAGILGFILGIIIFVSLRLLYKWKSQKRKK